jgi:hypothetical protein
MLTFLIVYAIVFVLVYQLMTRKTTPPPTPNSLFGEPFGPDMTSLELMLSTAAEEENEEQDDFFNEVTYEFYENGSIQQFIDDIIWEWEAHLSYDETENPTQIRW